MSDELPENVRYIKNGEGHRWWKIAKAQGQIHAGWPRIPGDLLQAPDLPAIEGRLRSEYVAKTGFRQDMNQLLALLERPSQYMWVTFEDGCMWWCTARDGITVNPEGESRERGHFWLTCDKPWSNLSLGGRELATANLPGVVSTTQGFRGTNCQPDGWREILRIVSDGEDVDAAAALEARKAYEAIVQRLVQRLHPKDFEVLIDLILSRTGWARLAKLGGVTEGIDVEVENAAIDEIAFVQVKSRADQSVLTDYIARFRDRPRYHRMIFAVHTPQGKLVEPADPRIQLWEGKKIAEMVVKHGLGDWVASHV